MESWNVASEDGSDEYVLLNKCKTQVRVNKRCGLSISAVLAKLEELNFPLDFTEGIRLINFRYIRGGVYGLYGDDEVDVGVKKGRELSLIVETLIHEVAHHVDSEDDLSSDLTQERKMRGKHIKHRAAQRSDAEYFARGFERFYSEKKRDRQELRMHNPKLYSKILKLHRKHSSR